MINKNISNFFLIIPYLFMKRGIILKELISNLRLKNQLYLYTKRNLIFMSYFDIYIIYFSVDFIQMVITY